MHLKKPILDDDLFSWLRKDVKIKDILSSVILSREFFDPNDYEIKLNEIIICLIFVLRMSNEI